jgi:hypothetical protein
LIAQLGRRGRVIGQRARAATVARASCSARSGAGPRPRPPRPSPRSGERHRPGQSRTAPSPHPSGVRPPAARPAPTADISASASARCGLARARALPIIAVMPRPMAAGVLGMARTIGVRAPETARLVSGHGGARRDRQDQRVADAQACQLRQRRAHHLRLDRQHQHRRGFRAAAFRCTPCGSQSEGWGSITQTDAAGSARLGQPARQHREPILPQPSSTSPFWPFPVPNSWKAPPFARLGPGGPV